MLTLRNADNLDSVLISGDYRDINTLHQSLYTIVGRDGEYAKYRGVRKLVLRFCSDLQDAIQVNQQIELVENGIDADKMNTDEGFTPDKNVYFKCTINYPEVLFVFMALNDFVRCYAKKKAKSARFPLSDQENILNSTITNVRLFQGEVVKCLQQKVTKASFKRIMSLMHEH